MANKVAELYADFRVNFARATLDVANTALGELRLGTLAEIASLAGLTKMLFNAGQGALKTATHLHTLAAVYGFNKTQLQDMERAALAANVSTDKFESSIIGLQQNLAGLNLGQVNAGFLEAAGRFGLNVAPGMDADKMMDQLMKKVPQFLKAHKGAVGQTMASMLLGQMGLDPEMIQYITTGKKAVKGPDIKDPMIESLTKTSEALHVLSFDVRNLSTNYIGPLVNALQPLSGAITTVGDYMSRLADGITALAEAERHPLQTAGSAAAGFFGGHANYITAAQQKQSADYLLRLRNAHPLQGFGSFAAQTFFGKPGAGGGGNVHSETNITVQGSADAATVRLMDKKLNDHAQRQKRDNAMFTAVNNPVGQ